MSGNEDRSVAVNMVMEIEGIESDFCIGDFKNVIEVIAWSWGASRTKDREGILQKFETIYLTKYIDRVSPQLVKYYGENKVIKNAKLTVLMDKNKDSFEMIFEDLCVSSISTGGSSGEERLFENIGFDFKKLEFKYFPDSDSKTSINGTINYSDERC